MGIALCVLVGACAGAQTAPAPTALSVPAEIDEVPPLAEPTGRCAWDAGKFADVVPDGHVPANGDPAGAFPLRAAAAGLLGSGQLIATISTTVGDIECRLHHEHAPYAVANFVGLANGTRPFKDSKTGKWVHRPAYERTQFHRVIRHFVAQGGGQNGDGTGDPGYRFPVESSGGLRFDRGGVLAMASRGPNTNGMQFFITDGPIAHLSPLHYTIFGQCNEDTALSNLMAVPTEGTRPITPVYILSVTITPEHPCR